MKESTKRNPTQRDLQAETRRNQLLDIALALFSQRGVENVSIKDLAAEAQVAQGLIYYYFESKDELLAAVFQRHNPFPQLQAIIEQISDLPAREGLLELGQRIAVLIPEKRLVFRLLARELLSPRSNLLLQALPSRDETMALLARYLQSRVAAGELRPHEPLAPIYLLTSSFVILSLREQTSPSDQTLESLAPQLVETVLDGIRAA